MMQREKGLRTTLCVLKLDLEVLGTVVSGSSEYSSYRPVNSAKSHEKILVHFHRNLITKSRKDCCNLVNLSSQAETSVRSDSEVFQIVFRNRLFIHYFDVNGSSPFVGGRLPTPSLCMLCPYLCPCPLPIPGSYAIIQYRKACIVTRTASLKTRIP